MLSGVSRYEFVRKLAQGGMGEVFLAIDREGGGQVAVKRALGDPSNSWSTRLLQREAEILRSLPRRRVSGTARLVDIFDESGITYLVEEYIAGESLEAWQRTYPSLSEFLDVYARLAVTLSLLHSVHVIHRDVKPSNVIIFGGRPYILDFGLAAHGGRRSSVDADDDDERSISGTPLYMPPESCFGTHQITGAADVFSLGVMLYQGLTGQLPFPIPNVDQVSALLTHRGTVDLASDDLFPALSLTPAILDAFRRMVSLEPAKRPTAFEAANALRAAAAIVRIEPTLAPATVPLPNELRSPSRNGRTSARTPGIEDAASRIAQLEEQLDRTMRITETVAKIVTDLGKRFDPNAVEAMIRSSIFILLKYQEGFGGQPTMPRHKRGEGRGTSTPVDEPASHQPSVSSTPSSHVSTFERLLLAGLGFIFLAVLAYAGLRDRPITDAGQLLMLRVVAAVSGAACAAMIPGFIDIAFRNFVRAGGALAVFATLWFTNPPALVAREKGPTVEEMPAENVKESDLLSGPVDPGKVVTTGVTSAITSKPATRDRLKSGHFVSFGDAVNYFELESFVKLAAL